MKTLYVSDLDGTLLHSDEKTSDYTNRIINQLSEKGMLFSYATARSFATSKKVTRGLHVKVPLIVNNGAFVIDNMSGKILLSHYFEDSVKYVFQDLFDHEVYPFVYSYIDEAEKFSYIEDKCTRGMKDFINSRKGDKRANSVNSEKELVRGNCFYITCIDEPEKLRPLYDKYKETYHCVFQRDIYSNEQWFEIMPLKTSKSNAILQLKELLGCEKLVVFGDGKNDIDMFEVADECYAVENAVGELKAIATEVIGNNNEDGVVKWLEKHYRG